MGDRTNFVLTAHSTENAKTLKDALVNSVVLYGHWAGYSAGPSVAEALRHARGRWEDASYSMRIVVSRIIGDQWRQETGFGLLAGKTSDNERSVLVLDFARKKVVRFGEANEYLSPEHAGAAAPTAEWSFEEFSSFDEADARFAHLGSQD